jgi:hypothetical protein
VHDVASFAARRPRRRVGGGGGGAAAAALQPPAFSSHKTTHTHTHAEESLGCDVTGNPCGVEPEKGSQIQLARVPACDMCTIKDALWFEDDTDIRHGLPLLPSRGGGGGGGVCLMMSWKQRGCAPCSGNCAS